MDKNLRPYAISCDWLQISVAMTQELEIIEHTRYDEHGKPLPPEWQPYNGYLIQQKDYGTKVFKSVYEIADPDGVSIGILACHPHSKALKGNLGILKINNEILYQSDFLHVTLELCAALNLQYKGITRLDLCYDCNELYGGLLPQNLIKKYKSNHVLKLGNNNYMEQGSVSYSIKRAGKSMENRRYDEPGADSWQEVDGTIHEHVTEGITWGTRSSGIQVQIYNKSKELDEVKYKHYIVDYWRQCGVDPERTVYRIEIRISHGRKVLQNQITGDRAFLRIDDLVAQQTIESLFKAFSYRYFSFFINNGERGRIRRMKELRIFCIEGDCVVRPRCRRSIKDYTRTNKMILNSLDKMVEEAEKEELSIVDELKVVRAFYIDNYGMEKWYKDHIQQIAPAEDEEQGTYERMGAQGVDEYMRKFEGDIAKRAALARKMIEEKIKEKHNAGKQED